MEDEFSPVMAGRVVETVLPDAPLLRGILLFPPLPSLLRIKADLGTNPHQRHDPLPVVPVSRVGSAGEFLIGEDDQVSALPVATFLGTGGAAGGDLAGGTTPDLLQPGHIEGHDLFFRVDMTFARQRVSAAGLERNSGLMTHQRRVSLRLFSSCFGYLFTSLPK